MKIHDLSQPYKKTTAIFPEADELNNVAWEEFWWNGFIAIECGQIVAEKYDQIVADENTYLPIYSITKTWVAMLFGVMAREGLISINETLYDIWPNETIWEAVDDAEVRQEVTIEQIVQFRGGFELPESVGQDLFTDMTEREPGQYEAGGKDFNASINYHLLNTSNAETFEYLTVGNLASYIILERTGMTPEQYMSAKVFPLLGITEDDYKWDSNADGVSQGFHGLSMTVTAMSKLPMLYLQRGMANENDRIIDEEWIDASFTLGDSNPNNTWGKFGYITWSLDTLPVICTGGLGGQRVCLNPENNRVIAILADTADDFFNVLQPGISGDWASGPTERFTQAFMYEPKMRIQCGGENDGNYTDADGVLIPPEELRSSSAFTSMSVRFLAVGCALATIFVAYF